MPCRYHLSFFSIRLDASGYPVSHGESDLCDIPSSERHSTLVWTLLHVFPTESVLLCIATNSLALFDSFPGEIGQPACQALNILTVDRFDGGEETGRHPVNAAQSPGERAGHGG